MALVTVLSDDALHTFHIIPTADQRFTADANLRESAGVRIREKMKFGFTSAAPTVPNTSSSPFQ